MATFTYKCPNCGAPVSWSASDEHIHCDYCSSEFTAEEVEKYNEKRVSEAEQRESGVAGKRPENSASSAAASEQGQGGSRGDSQALRSYHCDSCGAEVITDDQTTASFCYYCHNPVILTDRLSGDFCPEEIIPFKIGRKEAEAKLIAWAKIKRYVPKSFTSQAQLEKLTGLYLPFWHADASAEIHLEGRGTIVKVHDTATNRVRETNIYAINRNGMAAFRNMLELAFQDSDKIDPKMLATISNYHLDEVEAFRMPYLSGYFAERYSGERVDGERKMMARGKSYAKQTIQSELSGFNTTDLQVNEARTTVDKLSYLLLPAWVMTYYYLGKRYVYVMNGQTGETFGELPVDRKRLGLGSLVAALIILALLLLGGRFLW